MTVQEILTQVELTSEGVKSKSSGKIYTVEDFVNQICGIYKFGRKERRELESYFISYIRPQSEKSKYFEEILDKYKIKFSDGVYLVNDEIISVDDLYRLMWKNEKLLPEELTPILQNVEMVSETIDLQDRMFRLIDKKFDGKSSAKSEYLASLDKLYPDIPFRKIMYNILFPNTKPMFHIFYDDGVGGTGKSTFLEVLTLIVGEQNVSNVLLDQFGNRFVFSNMLGKYLNIGDDNGKNDELQNVGTLKSIVTGGRVTIDRKFLQPIECRIKAKQLFATNIMPYIDFTDGGLMRRLNIVPMNKVIPKTMKLCKLDEVELCRIFNEVKQAGDLEENQNELAITTSPLYRFNATSDKKDYDYYKDFCSRNGFRCMNVINFETKMKFVENYIKRKPDELKEIKEEGDMPF